jgi:hypothetical protein
MVRLTQEQLDLLDREVEHLRATTPAPVRITRSDALRHALVELARRQRAA